MKETALPRVTEILKPFSAFKHVPPDILENAANRGTKVHAICAALASGAWVPFDKVDEALQGYIKSFQSWSDSFVESYLWIEQRFNHKEFGYTGQIDFVVIGKDKQIYLVDLKTSAQSQKTYPVQLGAYRMLLAEHEMTVNGCILVYLSKEGKDPKTETLLDTKKEENTFRCALDCWYYFNSKPEKI